MKLLAVLLPTYNSAHYLRCSIDSLLQQSFEDFDLYVYDDCSTDDTGNLVDSYQDSRVNYRRNIENLGIAKTLNKGFEETHGSYKYIARMDADDWCYPERFKKQLAFLESNLDVGMCGTQGYWVNAIDELPKVNWTYPLFHEDIRINLLFAASFGHSSVVFRSSSLSLTSPYDPDVSTCEDWDLWTRLVKEITMANLPEFLMQYRIDTESNHRSEAHKELHLTERSKILSNYWAQFGITLTPTAVYDYYYGQRQLKTLIFIKDLKQLLLIFNTLDKNALTTLDSEMRSYFRYKFLRFALGFWKRSKVSRYSFRVWLTIFKNVYFANPLTIIKSMMG